MRQSQSLVCSTLDLKLNVFESIGNRNLFAYVFYNLGREFYFKVNGIQMYSKGSNSIPIHVLPERATPEMTRWLLESAKEVHTNMIRVWGGGLYESDIFFEVGHFEIPNVKHVA